MTASPASSHQPCWVAAVFKVPRTEGASLSTPLRKSCSLASWDAVWLTSPNAA